MKYMATLFFGLLFLCSCMPSELSMFRVKSYSENPVPLRVGEILIRSEVMHYDRLPHIENTIPLSPESALKSWANDRFYASVPGSTKKAIFLIREASLTQTDNPSEEWYVFDNVIYKLQYQVVLLFQDGGGHVFYTQSVGGTEFQELPRRSSLYAKEKIWEKMLNAMLEKVDRKMLSDLPDALK